MSNYDKSLCDTCKLNYACGSLDSRESCDMYCYSHESAIYKAFKMGYDAGYNFGYMDCETEFEDSLNELKEGLDELEIE